MKSKFRKVLLAMCVTGLFLACGLTVSAGSQPTLTASETMVSVSHDDTSKKVKINVKEWKGSQAYVVKYAVDDPSVAKVELSSQKSDSFEIKIKAKGTGTTVVKVWLDGYSRSCQFIIVKSVNYQREQDSGYSVRHYGYMTGTKGEAATIDDFEIRNVDGENRLYVYFTLKDKGQGNTSSITFTAKCEENDGDLTGNVQAVASGMAEGGSGYKIYFKIPPRTEVIKLVNDDL